MGSSADGADHLDNQNVIIAGPSTPASVAEPPNADPAAFHTASPSGLEPRVVMFDARYPPPFTGGKERQAHLLACALRDLSVAVRAVTLRYGRQQPDELDGVAVARFPNDIRRFHCIAIQLLRCRASSNICHVHTPSWIGIYTGIVARALGYKVIFKIPNVQLSTRHGRLWRAALRSFDWLVVLDESTRQEYEAAGIDPERIFLGTNGVVVQERRNPSDRPVRPVEVLYLGRFVAQKGCRQLLAAARLLGQQAVGWHLTLMGSGPLQEELRATIEASGLTKLVALAPWQEDVYPVLRRADIMVVPSEREGMSNAILEAMSVGVPVVATDVGAARRLLGNEGNRFIVAPNDTAPLCEAIRALVCDPSAREEYGAALHARAKRLFDIQVVAREYKRLYERTLKSASVDAFEQV